MLVGASPGLADPSERAARRAADVALAERLETLEIEAFAREWGAQPLFAGQPARVAAGAYADRLRNTPAGLAAALRGLGTGVMEPLWDRLPELEIPVTLVVGERDEKFRALADAMLERLPDAPSSCRDGHARSSRTRPRSRRIRRSASDRAWRRRVGGRGRYQSGSPSSSASA